MIPPPLFRRAEARDAVLLTAIALAAKRHWGYPDDWMEAWRPDLTVTPGYIQREAVQVMEVGGEVAGFVGLLGEEGSLYLEHLWLRPPHIGRGFGRVLFLEAVRMARAAGASELRIKSDPNAEEFYLKMGAVRTGSEAYLLLGRFPREVPLLVYRLS